MIKPGIGFHPLFYYGERIRIIVLEMMFFVDCHIEKIDDYHDEFEIDRSLKHSMIDSSARLLFHLSKVVLQILIFVKHFVFEALRKLVNSTRNARKI